MKSVAIRTAAFLFGMLVVMIILEPERFGTLLWQTYNDPSGNFSLKFPNKPRAGGQELKLDGGGTADMKIVTATPNKTTSYAFMYLDDPASAGRSVEEVLNGARDGAISKIHGALLDEQRIQFDGHQARDILVRNGLTSMLNVRIIFDGHRLVMLTVETAGQKFDSKNVQNFFDSLKLSR